MTEQELFQAILQAEANDRELTEILKKIRAGTADFQDTQRYSARCAEIEAKILSQNLSPAGTGQNEQNCQQLLENQFEDTIQKESAVQKALDQKQNIHIQPKKPKFPAVRVRKAAHSLEDETVSEDVLRRRAENAVANIAASFHDDYIKENSEFRQKAGLSCHVSRIGAFKCCAWCAKLAGRYEKGREPAEFWKRHDKCTCQIVYENSKSRQRLSGNGNGWKVDAEVRRRQNAAKIEYKPTRFTPEQAAALERQQLSQYRGLTIPGKTDTEFSLFRRIEYDESNPLTAKREREFKVYQVLNSQNTIFVSEGARQEGIKPKEFHQIDVHLSEVYKMMRINQSQNLPSVYIIDSMEMNKNAAAAYNPILNILYVNKNIALYENDNVPPGMNQFACYKDDRSSYVHELYHWFDAEKFRHKYGEVTQENYSSYINFINQEAKKKLDKLEKTGYNKDSISQYASDEYADGRYYETYTEYRVIDLLRGK